MIVTGWAGTLFAEIAAHTLPVLGRYAAKHGLTVECVNLAGERPPSWMKVNALHDALGRHDRVVWIDADVVVLDHSRNILDELGVGWQGLVEHQTECGTVPNCGVWVADRRMRPVLEQIWNAGRNLHHPWWEQASVLEMMGYTVSDAPTAMLGEPTPLWHHTTWLGPEWNHHPFDARRVDTPRFVHVTQYQDRLDAVRRIVGACNADS